MKKRKTTTKRSLSLESNPVGISVLERHSLGTVMTFNATQCLSCWNNQTKGKREGQRERERGKSRNLERMSECSVSNILLREGEFRAFKRHIPVNVLSLSEAPPFKWTLPEN